MTPILNLIITVILIGIPLVTFLIRIEHRLTKIETLLFQHLHPNPILEKDKKTPS